MIIGDEWWSPVGPSLGNIDKDMNMSKGDNCYEFDMVFMDGKLIRNFSWESGIKGTQYSALWDTLAVIETIRLPWRAHFLRFHLWYVWIMRDWWWNYMGISLRIWGDKRTFKKPAHIHHKLDTKSECLLLGH